MTRLNELTAGSVASLLEVGGDRSFRRRLMELGLLPGTPLRLVRRVGIGDLLELEVRGCHLSLRCADARNVLVDGALMGHGRANQVSDLCGRWSSMLGFNHVALCARGRGQPISTMDPGM